MRYLYSVYADSAQNRAPVDPGAQTPRFFTLIGIIIGVAAVVVVGASISGLNTYVTERVAKILGANHFMIARMASHGRMSDDEFERRNRRNKQLNWDDYEWVRDRCRLCRSRRRTSAPGGSETGRHRISRRGHFRRHRQHGRRSKIRRLPKADSFRATK